MAYNVNHSDVANYGSLIVEDKTINNDTSLSLVGRFYPGYSKHISENFLHLLENFASDTAPSSPTRGQLWFDTDSDSNPPLPKLMMWNGTRWISVGLVTRTADTPTSPADGDLWVDPINHVMKMWSGTGWKEFITDISGGSGIKIVSVNDSSNISHTVLVAYINSVATAILSNDNTFTMNPGNDSSLDAFDGVQIKPGINIPPSTYQYYGWSEKALALKKGSTNTTITSSDLFIKADNNETTGSITIKNSNGILISDVNSSKTFSVKVNSNDITTASTTDLLLKSNSGSTILSLLSSSVTINKPVSITGTLTSTNLSTTGITASTLAVNSATFSSKVEITTDGKILPVSALNIYGFIGGSTKRWDTIYSNTVDANNIGNAGTTYIGTLADTVKLNGKSILNSATTFNLSKDVVGSVVAGSNTSVNIVASLSSQVISNQTAITSILPNDVILVERSGGLKYISIDNFNVSNTLIGSIILYAGATVPDKYKLCNGQSLSKSTYPGLFDVIGSSYGATSTTFNVPTVTHAVPTLKYYIYAGKN